MNTNPQTKRTGRSASYVIAASDALAIEKQQADEVCKGNVTQDTAMIESALSTYYNVKLTSGNYYISNLNTNNGSAFNLHGSGWKTILNMTTDNTDCLAIGQSSPVTYSTFSDFKIDGGTPWTDTGRIGIHIYDGSYLNFHNVYVYDCSDWGVSVDFNHSVFFNQCHLRRNGWSNTTGNLRMGTQSTIANVVKFISGTIDLGGKGVEINKGSLPTLRDVMIESCNYYAVDINQTLGRGVIIDGLYMENNSLLDSTTYDIYAQQCGDFLRLHNIFNSIRNAAYYDLYATQNAEGLDIENFYGEGKTYIHPSALSYNYRRLYNSFACPAPGTDWTPTATGVQLAANKSTKKSRVVLSNLALNDIIHSLYVVGDMVKVAGDTVTLDAKLVRVNKADPITTTDIAGGAIAQVTADGNFDAVATLTAAEIVATDKQYNIELNGSTSNVSTTEKIDVTGVEAIIIPSESLRGTTISYS